MTRKAFYLVLGAYALLAVGAIVSLYLLSHQADDIDKTNERLIGAAVAYCQAGIAPDDEETRIIDALSRGLTIPAKDLDPICQRIAQRLKGAGDGD